MSRAQFISAVMFLSLVGLVGCGQGGAVGGSNSGIGDSVAANSSSPGTVINPGTGATPAPSPTNPPTTSIEVCPELNQERAKAGLPPLESNGAIEAVANSYALDMAARGYFSHVSPEGVELVTRLKSGSVPYGYAGENIAKGYANCQDVFVGWMNSPGHRANILNVHYHKYGMAMQNLVWVLDFTD